MQDNPLLQDLGVQLTHWADNQCALTLKIEPRHLNRQSSLHGGVIATLLDAACGYAGIYNAPGEPERQAATISLNISYIKGVQEGLIEATAHVTGAGRKIYFSSAELKDEAGNMIATAQGSFKRFTPRT